MKIIGAVSPYLQLLGVPSRSTPNSYQTTADSTRAVMSDNSFTVRLEKHISDYKRGRGYLSKEVGAEISQKDIQTSSSLDPKNLKSYSGYLVGFAYDKQARFVNGVQSGVQTAQSITSTNENKLDSAALENQIKNIGVKG